MSKYTTGEIAKLCGITVRTVQYYDTRGILVPSELTEGGGVLQTDGHFAGAGCAQIRLTVDGGGADFVFFVGDGRNRAVGRAY